jgi:hypothetical protein
MTPPRQPEQRHSPADTEVVDAELHRLSEIFMAVLELLADDVEDA